MADINSEFNFKDFQSRLLRISSEDKDSSTSSNNNFTVSIPGDAGKMDKIVAVIVKKMTCANMFPNVPYYANQIVLEAGGDPGVSIPVVIPIAQYTATELKTALQTAINAVITPDSVVVALTTDNKYEFTFTGDTYGFLTAGSTAGSRVGFLDDIADGAVVTMPLLPNLIGETELYVHSRTVASGNMTEPSGTFNVVDMLDLNVAYGSTAYSQFDDAEQHTLRYLPYESERSFRRIDVRLRNREGNLLTLPDNFHFNMILKVYYDT